MGADVAVVVGNYQGEQVLPDCLESLSSQTEPLAEVVVVDGGSSDGSRLVVAAHAARFLAERNGGLGFLYNRGVEATSTPFVLLLNNDVALEPDCVRQLATALREGDSRFAADATQLDWSRGSVIHARTTMRRGRLLHEFIPGFHLDPLVAAEGTVATVAAHGAAMLVRRSMFVALGGFDEAFFLEWEDLDLCWRAWLRGWSSVYVSGATLRHRVGAVTTPALAPRRRASSHHNILRFALKCLPAGAAARVVWGELLRAPRRPLTVSRALARIVVEMPEIVRSRHHSANRRQHLEAVLSGALESR